MLKISGICLRTLEEQENGGDSSPIDPETVDFAPYVPVRIEFNGPFITGALLRLHEGRIWADFTVNEGIPVREGLVLAVGFLKDGLGSGRTVISDISISRSNSDQLIPPYDVTVVANPEADHK